MDKFKAFAKDAGDKAWAGLDVVGQQVNKASNKLGTESFWPMPLDQECDKAARILRTFVRDGFQVKEEQGGKQQKVLRKIPPKALQQAKGLAIFTTMRSGLHWSGAGGSGIMISRLPDGSWSAPSGLLIHTLGIGFMIGIDVYDTVLVLRTQKAVETFAHPKVSLGAELSVAAGPYGNGGAMDVGTDGSPAWAYTKSKGFYAGVQVDGTIIIERNDENARFYGRKVKAAELIAGGIPRPRSTDGLVQTIEMAEGKQTTGDRIPTGPPPSDLEPPTTSDIQDAGAAPASQTLPSLSTSTAASPPLARHSHVDSTHGLVEISPPADLPSPSRQSHVDPHHGFTETLPPTEELPPYTELAGQQPPPEKPS